MTNLTTKKGISEAKYRKLLRDVRAIVAEAREDVERVTRQRLVETYWQIGRRISEEKLLEEAQYGDALLEDLAEEMDMDVRTLQNCVRFFKTYKTTPRSRHLSWSHFKELLRLPEAADRLFYEKKIEAEGWNRDQLLAAMKRRVHESKTGKKAKAKETLERPPLELYGYKAKVERVIDGDTLLLRIDLGFQVWKEQRVRLAGLDTPALDEPGGKEAHRFVRDRLALVPFVVVKTRKIDIYGRYVGHIFYDPAETNRERVAAAGRYLNEELLEAGLARRV